MRRKHRLVKVYLDIPPDAIEEDVIEYVLDAVATWRGQLYPGGIEGYNDNPHPMYDLDADSITVTM